MTDDPKKNGKRHRRFYAASSLLLQQWISFFLSMFIFFFIQMMRIIHALRAKMSISHEKEFNIDKNGVYPIVRKLPSSLCCFKVMHIRTGTLWIAYCEIMWIVTQFSFWTAECVVREAFPPYVIIFGFTFTIIQLVMTSFLIRGVQTFRLSYIEIYMVGVFCRILLFVSFFFIFVFFLIVTDESDRFESKHFFHRFLPIKILFTGSYTLLKAFALNTAYRCYSYIAKTRRALVHMTLYDESDSNVQHDGSSISTLRSVLPNHKCRHIGCRVCCNSTTTTECGDVLAKSSIAKQISQIPHLQCSSINNSRRHGEVQKTNQISP